MKELKNLSRLPEQPEYWERLGSRIQEHAHPLITSATRQDAWIRVALRVSIAATAAAGLVLLLQRPAPQVTPSVFAGLAPADPVAVRLVARDRPPAVSELFTSYQRRGQ